MFDLGNWGLGGLGELRGLGTWGLGGLGTWGLGGLENLRFCRHILSLSPRLPISLSPHSSFLIPHPFKDSVASCAIELPVRKHEQYEIVHLLVKRY